MSATAKQWLGSNPAHQLGRTGTADSPAGSKRTNRIEGGILPAALVGYPTTLYHSSRSTMTV